MAYSTVDNLQTSYPRLASTNASSATLNSWLSRSSNYIDGYIAQVVTLPLSPAPPLISSLCEDLAFAMFMRRHVGDLGKEKGLLLLWEDIHNMLNAMRDGQVDILNASGVSLSSLGGAPLSPWSSLKDYVPTFGIGDLEDAVVDPNRILEEESER